MHELVQEATGLDFASFQTREAAVEAMRACQPPYAG
jgi:lysyl-tRNA synthetase class 2